MAKVEAVGGFFPLDDQGHIVNPTRRNHITAVWHPVLAAILETYHKHFDAKLKSLWIRGSLARGLVKPNWSDLDIFGLIEQAPSVRWATLEILPQEEKKLRRLLPIGFDRVPLEMMYSTFNSSVLAEMPKIGMMIKTQSLCWWGNDISHQLPSYQPGMAVMLNYRWLAEDWNTVRGKTTTSRTSYQSFIKTVVRTAFELVMQRLGKYTTDLYWCAEAFAQYYPKEGITLKKILNLYDQPLKEKYQLTALLEEITPWMISESKRQIS
ncbi:MAG: nucleotidyltransferase domain-containing protein [Saprospiraceae bacterium]|nr:nucleotidyltransferase domain-containing protein [Saprospiraceae bacterium]